MKFIFDLDGTICFKGKPVSKEILDCLESLTKKGHEVIFASARPIRDIQPILDENFHHYSMIGGNGSLISRDRKIIHSNTFTSDEIRKIIALINKYEATYLIDSDWDYAYTGPTDHPILQNVDPLKSAKLVEVESLTRIVKILLLTSVSFEKLAEELSTLDVYINTHGNEGILDISPKGINKWSALNTLGIEKGTYVAFGNDANDVSMFENALHSVMIGHHDQLSYIASESIPLQNNYEQEIIKKLKELANKYSLMEA